MSCSVKLPKFPMYNVVIVLSSGGGSAGIAAALFNNLSATGSFIPAKHIS